MACCKKKLSTVSSTEVLTGGAKAASIIESTPDLGNSNSRRNFNTRNAKQDKMVGTSRMRFVCTTPGSATLCSTIQKMKVKGQVESLLNEIVCTTPGSATLINRFVKHT